MGRRAVLEVGGAGPLPAVCNAGRGLLGPLEVHSVDAVGSVLDVNVVGTVRVLQAFLPDMKRRRSGRILVTASMGGLMGKWKGDSARRHGHRAAALQSPARTCSSARLSGLFSPPRAALQRCLLRQQVRDRRFMRESGDSAAALRGPVSHRPDPVSRLAGVVPRRSPCRSPHLCARHRTRRACDLAGEGWHFPGKLGLTEVR